MNCPDCFTPMPKTAGGNRNTSGSRTSYRACRNEDCISYQRRAKTWQEPHQAEVFAGWVDESRAETVNWKIINRMVVDDLVWFGRVSEETLELVEQLRRQRCNH